MTVGHWVVYRLHALRSLDTMIQAMCHPPDERLTERVICGQGRLDIIQNVSFGRAH